MSFEDYLLVIIAKEQHKAVQSTCHVIKKIHMRSVEVASNLIADKYGLPRNPAHQSCKWNFLDNEAVRQSVENELHRQYFEAMGWEQD